MFQKVAVAQCLVAHLGAVVVDGLDRIAQEVGYLLAVGKAQADECEDSQFGAEATRIAFGQLLFGSKKRIKICFERGEEAQEGLVETAIEFIQLLVDDAGVLDGFEQLAIVAREGSFLQRETIGLDLGDASRAGY